MKKSKPLGLPTARARKKAETFERGHVRALQNGDIPPRGRPRNSYVLVYVSVTRYSRRIHRGDGAEIRSAILMSSITVTITRIYHRDGGISYAATMCYAYIRQIF